MAVDIMTFAAEVEEDGVAVIMWTPPMRRKEENEWYKMRERSIFFFFIPRKSLRQQEHVTVKIKTRIF
jgi:hypothetical protein